MAGNINASNQQQQEMESVVQATEQHDIINPEHNISNSVHQLPAASSRIHSLFYRSGSISATSAPSVPIFTSQSSSSFSNTSGLRSDALHLQPHCGSSTSSVYKQQDSVACKTTEALPDRSNEVTSDNQPSLYYNCTNQEDRGSNSASIVVKPTENRHMNAPFQQISSSNHGNFKSVGKNVNVSFSDPVACVSTNLSGHHFFSDTIVSMSNPTTRKISLPVSSREPISLESAAAIPGFKNSSDSFSTCFISVSNDLLNVNAASTSRAASVYQPSELAGSSGSSNSIVDMGGDEASASSYNSASSMCDAASGSSSLTSDNKKISDTSSSANLMAVAGTSSYHSTSSATSVQSVNDGITLRCSKKKNNSIISAAGLITESSLQNMRLSSSAAISRKVLSRFSSPNESDRYHSQDNNFVSQQPLQRNLAVCDSGMPPQLQIVQQRSSESNEAHPLITEASCGTSSQSSARNNLPMSFRTRSPERDDCLVSSSTENANQSHLDFSYSLMPDNAHTTSMPLLDSTVDSTGDPSPMECLNFTSDGFDKNISYSSSDEDSNIISPTLYSRKCKAMGTAMSLEKVALHSFQPVSVETDSFSSSDNEECPSNTAKMNHLSSSFKPFKQNLSKKHTSYYSLHATQSSSGLVSKPPCEKQEDCHSSSEDSIGIASSFELGLASAAESLANDSVARSTSLLPPEQILEHHKQYSDGGGQNFCIASTSRVNERDPVDGAVASIMHPVSHSLKKVQVSKNLNTEDSAEPSCSYVGKSVPSSSKTMATSNCTNSLFGSLSSCYMLDTPISNDSGSKSFMTVSSIDSSNGIINDSSTIPTKVSDAIFPAESLPENDVQVSTSPSLELKEGYSQVDTSNGVGVMMTSSSVDGGKVCETGEMKERLGDRIASVESSGITSIISSEAARDAVSVMNGVGSSAAAIEDGNLILVFSEGNPNVSAVEYPSSITNSVQSFIAFSGLESVPVSLIKSHFSPKMSTSGGSCCVTDATPKHSTYLQDDLSCDQNVTNAINCDDNEYCLSSSIVLETIDGVHSEISFNEQSPNSSSVNSNNAPCILDASSAGTSNVKKGNNRHSLFSIPSSTNNAHSLFPDSKMCSTIHSLFPVSTSNSNAHNLFSSSATTCNISNPFPAVTTSSFAQSVFFPQSSMTNSLGSLSTITTNTSAQTTAFPANSTNSNIPILFLNKTAISEAKNECHTHTTNNNACSMFLTHDSSSILNSQIINKTTSSNVLSVLPSQNNGSTSSNSFLTPSSCNSLVMFSSDNISNNIDDSSCICNQTDDHGFSSSMPGKSHENDEFNDSRECSSESVTDNINLPISKCSSLSFTKVGSSINDSSDAHSSEQNVSNLETSIAIQTNQCSEQLLKSVEVVSDQLQCLDSSCIDDVSYFKPVLTPGQDGGIIGDDMKFVAVNFTGFESKEYLHSNDSLDSEEQPVSYSSCTSTPLILPDVQSQPASFSCTTSVKNKMSPKEKIVADCKSEEEQSTFLTESSLTLPFNSSNSLLVSSLEMFQNSATFSETCDTQSLGGNNSNVPVGIHLTKPQDCAPLYSMSDACQPNELLLRNDYQQRDASTDTAKLPFAENNAMLITGSKMPDINVSSSTLYKHNFEEDSSILYSNVNINSEYNSTEEHKVKKTAHRPVSVVPMKDFGSCTIDVLEGSAHVNDAEQGMEIITPLSQSRITVTDANIANEAAVSDHRGNCDGIAADDDGTSDLWDEMCSQGRVLAETCGGSTLNEDSSGLRGNVSIVGDHDEYQQMIIPADDGNSASLELVELDQQDIDETCSKLAASTSPSPHSIRNVRSSRRRGRVQHVETEVLLHGTATVDCSECASSGQCSLHPVHSVTDRTVLTRAWATLPTTYLTVRPLPGGQEYGVFTKRRLLPHTRFGPMTGVLRKLPSPPSTLVVPANYCADGGTAGVDGTANCNGISGSAASTCDDVTTGNTISTGDGEQSVVARLSYRCSPADTDPSSALYLDTSDMERSNWMCFVRAAPSFLRQNCLLEETTPGQLCFLTTGIVLPNTELLLGYSKSYAEKYGFKVLKPTPEEEQALAAITSWPCYECDAQLPSSALLQQHLACHETKEVQRRRGRGRSSGVRRRRPYEQQKEARGKRIKMSRTEPTTGASQSPSREPEDPTAAAASASPAVLTDEAVEEASPEQLQLRCLICKKMFQHVKVLSLHVLQHRSGSSSRQQLQPSLDARRCPQCDEEHDSLEELLQHVDSHAVVLSGSGRSARSGGATHAAEGPLSAAPRVMVLVSDPPKMYECPMCRLKLPSLPDLRTHLPHHRDQDGLYRCPACSKQFDTYKKVRRHIRAYCFETFTCGVCGRALPSSVKLSIHMLTHSDRRDFKCNVCGNAFKRKDKLKDHQKRMHGPVSKSKQSHSSKTTPSKSSVKRKSGLQLGLPYLCSMCLVGFKRRGMLVNHYLKRHPGVPVETVPELSAPLPSVRLGYPCSHCNKSYRSNIRRKMHIAKVHPGRPIVGADVVVQCPSSPSLGIKGGTSLPRRYAVKCRWCQREYLTQAKLNQHHKKFHADMLVLETAVSGVVQQREQENAERGQSKNNEEFVMQFSQDHKEIKHLQHGQSPMSIVDSYAVDKRISGGTSARVNQSSLTNGFMPCISAVNTSPSATIGNTASAGDLLTQAMGTISTDLNGVATLSSLNIGGNPSVLPNGSIIQLVPAGIELASDDGSGATFILSNVDSLTLGQQELVHRSDAAVGKHGSSHHVLLSKPQSSELMTLTVIPQDGKNSFVSLSPGQIFLVGMPSSNSHNT